ncbi:MAG: response regulator [Theionarchaea archaeon]|nr:response regulator [Theionarchaea archaeon]
MVKIVVVEDESIVAKDIKRRLQNLGYTVSAIVSSGEEALEVARENPDLYLMDIVLRGEIDGIAAAERLRTQFGIPVIYVTAHADEKTLGRAKMTEPYGYILKPFEDRELHTAIEMALYKHGMEKKLRESQQWLFTTLKSIGDAVIATDTEGLITFMNPVAEALTGWNQEEAAGTFLSEVFHIINEETRKRCENPFEKIVRTGKGTDLANNTILVARDGTELFIADSGAPIRDESHILGTVLIFRDITEKRRIEQEMLKTQKLESLSILAGGIAHDFNNILTAILSNANLARMYAEDQRVTGKLAKIEKASLRAKDLMQQLFTFSKGGVPVKRTVSLKELIKDSASFALRGSNVRCHLHLPEDMWSVDVDAGQISQVMNNIIMNADQAMPEGGIIQVQAENVVIEEDTPPLKKGFYVRVTVTDEGIGILDTHLQRIFDPYFTTKQKGSGLGLSTAYAIINNHDGYITVESELGIGSTFCIYLPASGERGERKVEKPGKLQEGKGRILLMDDEESILEAAGELLQVLGYTVETVRDGDEAIQLYEKALELEQPFDAVIMDLTIPGGMGGKETIQNLLGIDPHVRAIVSSGYADDPVTVDYREHGFCGVVTKPYTVKELSETLHRVLQE